MSVPKTLVLVALAGCGARSALWLGAAAVTPADAGVAPEGAPPADVQVPRESADAGCEPAPDGGVVVPIDAPEAIYVAVAVTSDRLYVGTTTSGLSALDDGGVFEVPLPAAPATASVVTPPQYDYGQLVTDDTYVYYLQTMGESVGPNSADYSTTGIGAIAPDGTVSSTPSLLDPPFSTSSQSNGWMIAADPSASGVFWAGGGGGGPGATAIVRWTVGGMTTEVATGTSIEGIAVRGGFLYWGDDGVGPGITISRVPATGGTAESIATVSEGTHGSLLGVSDDDVVFVSDYMSAAIYVAPRMGGSPRPLVHATPPWVNDLAWVDDAYLYWVEDATSTVLRRIALAGGTEETVPTVGSVYSVAFDGCNAYIGSTGPTQVLVLPKPGG